MSSVETCCQCVHASVVRPLWRWKWYAAIILLGIVSILLIQKSMYAPDISDFDQIKQDVFAEKIYQDVLNRWYNFTDGVRWYNDKILSPLDPANWERYLADIRKHWILWKHNPNESYNLENPDLNDPSMGQAEVIRDIFKDKPNGFFVECGAYDGETRSNTLVLERFLDWTGLLVEADPLNFSKMLQKNRKAYLTPTCLAIEPYPSVNSFLMANNVGRLHEENAADNNLPNSPDVAYSGVHVSVQCFPFIDLMAALNVTTVNYFSLDIEGHELQVLKTIPFDKINIETLSVEFSHVENGQKELTDFMESKGYYVYSMVVRTDKLAHDIIFAKNDYKISNSIE
ncbi:Protein Star [Anthophora quadrimaculata]